MSITIILMFIGVLLAIQVIGIIYKSFSTLSGNNTNALPVFMAIWAGGLGVVLTIASIILNRTFEISAVTFVAAIFGGLSFAVGGILYIRVLSLGSFIWSTLMMNLSNFLPVVFALAFLGETISIRQIVGVFVILSILFVMSVKTKTGDRPFTAKWMILALVMMLGNGGLISAQKTQTHYMEGTQTVEFLALMFVFTSVFSLLWLLCAKLFAKQNIQNKPVPIGPLMRLTAAMAVCIGTGNILNMILMRHITAAVQFPLSVGAGIVLSAIVGVKLYREKPTWRLYLSAAMLIVGVVLLGA